MQIGRSRKRRRLAVVLLAMLGLGTAAGLTLFALSDTLVFFVTPGDLAEKPQPPGRTLRLGGLVEQGSVARGRGADGRPVATFRVTDGRATLDVQYAGILPDLFREGQGVVALGVLRPDGGFTASEVLAKHDETYMPPEVAEALKKSGEWRPESGQAPPPATWNTLSPRKPGG
jgi:cytochrome c-type biogenesis protein CcmE